MDRNKLGVVLALVMILGIILGSNHWIARQIGDMYDEYGELPSASAVPVEEPVKRPTTAPPSVIDPRNDPLAPVVKIVKQPPPALQIKPDPDRPPQKIYEALTSPVSPVFVQ